MTFKLTLKILLLFLRFSGRFSGAWGRNEKFEANVIQFVAMMYRKKHAVSPPSVHCNFLLRKTASHSLRSFLAIALLAIALGFKRLFRPLLDTKSVYHF